MKVVRVFLAIVIAAAAASCGRSDPEAAIREVLTAAETAAEARDGGFLGGLLAPTYSDSRGNDRTQMIDLIRGYFLAHSSFEIVTTIDEIVLDSADAARVVVHAGIVGKRAGQPLLGGLNGELQRVQLQLRRQDSDWQVTAASWQPAVGER